MIVINTIAHSLVFHRRLTSVFALVSFFCLLSSSFVYAGLDLVIDEEAALKGPEISIRVIETHLRNADTCYWSGMNEKGDMRTFKRGLVLLDDADMALDMLSAVEVLNDSGDGQGQVIRSLRSQISTLRMDIEKQAEMAHDTMRGLFPLSDFWTASLFRNPKAFKTYEIIDDPDIIAVTTTADNIFRILEDKYSHHGYIDVVFASHPPNRAYENEALYVFNTSPKFYVHQFHELCEALLVDGSSEAFPDTIQLFPRDNNSLLDLQALSKTANRLMESFNVPKIIIMDVLKKNTFDSIYFFEARAYLFKHNTQMPETILTNMGFARDRRGTLPILAAYYGFSLFAGLGLCVFITTRRNNALSTNWMALLALGVSAILMGRAVPFFVLPILSTLSPQGETLAVLSFWYPSLLGIALLVFPASIAYLFTHKYKLFERIPLLLNHGAALSVMVFLGIFSFMAQTIVVYTGEWSFTLTLPLLLSGIFLSYALGILIERSRVPVATFLLLIAIAALTGACYATASPVSAWLPVLPAFACAVYVSLCTCHAKAKMERQIGSESAGDGDALPELFKRTRIPTYIEFDDARDAYALCSSVLSRGKLAAALLGYSGSGKSRTGEHIVEKLTEQLKPDIVVGRSICTPLVEQRLPFEPVRIAIAEALGIDLAGTPDKHKEQLADLVGGAIESALLPFISFLVPKAIENNGGECHAFSRADMRARLFDIVSEVTANKTLVLFLDDCQWLDADSIELIRELYTSLPDEAKCLCLFAGTSLPDELQSLVNTATIFVGKADREKVCRLFAESLNFDSATIALLNRQMLGEAEYINMHDALDVVMHLVKKRYFEAIEGAGVPSSEHIYRYVGPEILPVPNTVRDRIRDQLVSRPEWRRVLRACACAGSKFRVSIVASALKYGDASLLVDVLDEIEAETDFVRDEKQEDDVYVFASPFMHRAFLSIMEIVPDTALDVAVDARHRLVGPHSDKIPQRIRTVHRALAEAYEGAYLAHEKQKYLEATASHYYLAGKEKAHKAFAFTLLAAQSAWRDYAYDQARDYLRMARDYVGFVQKRDVLDRAVCQLALSEAHVTGNRSLAETAYLDAVAFYEKQVARGHVDFQILLAITRNCYDRQDWKQASMFAEHLLASEDELINIEARQFKWLSFPPHERAQHLPMIESALNDLEKQQDSLPKREIKSRLYNSLANTLLCGSSEHLARAESLLKASLENRSHFADKRGMSMDHNALGELYNKMGNLLACEEHYRCALEIVEAIHDSFGEGRALCGLANCLTRQKQFESAETFACLAYQKAISQKAPTIFALIEQIVLYTAWHDHLADAEASANVKEKLDSALQAVLAIESIPPFLCPALLSLFSDPLIQNSFFYPRLTTKISVMSA